MGVRLNRRLWAGDKQAASHPEVDQPLSIGVLAVTEFADDVLSSAMDREESAAFKSMRLFGRRRFEWLLVGAEPDGQDGVTSHPLVDTASDCFHLREFGHCFILGECHLSISKLSAGDDGRFNTIASQCGKTVSFAIREERDGA